MLSGVLLFAQAQALLLDNSCRDNAHYGIVLTPDCQTTPTPEELPQTNQLQDNPRGPFTITSNPLADIGR